MEAGTINMDHTLAEASYLQEAYLSTCLTFKRDSRLKKGEKEWRDTMVGIQHN